MAEDHGIDAIYNVSSDAAVYSRQVSTDSLPLIPISYEDNTEANWTFELFVVFSMVWKWNNLHVVRARCGGIHSCLRHIITKPFITEHVLCLLDL
jgi:hypothetical protein